MRNAIWILVIAMLLGGRPAVAQDAAAQADELFNSLFSPRLETVKKTFSKEDDIALAKDLLAAAQEAKEQAVLVAKLCNTAFDLSSVNSKGYAVAIEAMDLLAESSPDHKAEALKNRLAIRQKMYRSAKRSERPDIGEQLIDDLRASADASAAAGDMATAIANLRTAMSTATSIKSDRKDELKEAYAAMQARKQLVDRIELFKRRLKTDPKDTAAAKGLVLTYLIDLNDPKEARKYSFLIDDEELKKVVKLSTADPASLENGDVLALADFYNGQATKAPASAKADLYRSALAYFKQFESRKPEGLAAVKAKITAGNIAKWLKSKDEPLVASGPSAGGRSSAASGNLPTGRWIDLEPYLIANAGDLDVPLPTKASVRKGDTVRIAPEKDWNAHGFMIAASPNGGYRFATQFAGEGEKFSANLRLPVGKRKAITLRLYNDSMRISIPGEDPIGRFPAHLESGKKYALEVQVAPKGEQVAIQATINKQPVFKWAGDTGILRESQGLNLLGASLYTSRTYPSAPMVFAKPRLYVVSGGAAGRTYQGDLELREKDAPLIIRRRRQYVYPTSPWTIIGRIKAGQTYKTRYRYEWKPGQGGEGISATGDATGKYFLQAKIGANGKPVKLAHLESFKAPKSGVLYMGMATEKPEEFWDNSGYITVEIQAEGAEDLGPPTKPQPITWMSVTRRVPGNIKWTPAGTVEAGRLYYFTGAQPYISGEYQGVKAPGLEGFIPPWGREGKFQLIGRVNGGKPFVVSRGRLSTERSRYLSFEKGGLLEFGIAGATPRLTGYQNVTIREIDMVSTLSYRRYDIARRHIVDTRDDD